MSTEVALQKFNDLSTTWLNFYEKVLKDVIDSQSGKPKAALVRTLLMKTRESVRQIEEAARSLEKTL